MSHMYVPSTPPPDRRPRITATPYLAELWLLRERPDGSGYAEPVDSRLLAVEVAKLISPYPDRVEAVDPSTGHWNVWLPDYMTSTWHMYGVDLDYTVGAFQIKISYEKV